MVMCIKVAQTGKQSNREEVRGEIAQSSDENDQKPDSVSVHEDKSRSRLTLARDGQRAEPASRAFIASDAEEPPIHSGHKGAVNMRAVWAPGALLRVNEKDGKLQLLRQV